MAIVVKPCHRRKGIATKLLNEVCLKKAKLFNLDVLKENIEALQLYQKLGFEIKEEYLGYGGYRVKKPKCYYMTKIKNN